MRGKTSNDRSAIALSAIPNHRETDSNYGSGICDDEGKKGKKVLRANQVRIFERVCVCVRVRDRKFSLNQTHSARRGQQDQRRKKTVIVTSSRRTLHFSHDALTLEAAETCQNCSGAI